MMTTEEKSLGVLVKISRNGERFWLRNCRKMDGKTYGQVDNELVSNPYSMGEIIEFTEDEVVDWITPEEVNNNE